MRWTSVCAVVCAYYQVYGCCMRRYEQHISVRTRTKPEDAILLYTRAGYILVLYVPWYEAEICHAFRAKTDHASGERNKSHKASCVGPGGRCVCPSKCQNSATVSLVGAARPPRVAPTRKVNNPNPRIRFLYFFFPVFGLAPRLVRSRYPTLFEPKHGPFKRRAEQAAQGTLGIRPGARCACLSSYQSSSSLLLSCPGRPAPTKKLNNPHFFSFFFCPVCRDVPGSRLSLYHGQVPHVKKKCTCCVRPSWSIDTAGVACSRTQPRAKLCDLVRYVGGACVLVVPGRIIGRCLPSWGDQQQDDVMQTTSWFSCRQKRRSFLVLRLHRYRTTVPGMYHPSPDSKLHLSIKIVFSFMPSLGAMTPTTARQCAHDGVGIETAPQGAWHCTIAYAPQSVLVRVA